MRSFSKFYVRLALLSTAGAEISVRDNITLQAPVVAVPSQHWEGNDGTWSTFEIRVGTPATTVRVLPATSWQEVWVIWGTAAGVCNTTAGVEANCQEQRGGVINLNGTSSTWEESTQNFLGWNEDLGYSGQAQYGFDTVGLGYTSGDGPTLPHQIVAEIQSQSFFLGQLGLGFQPTNFSTYGNPQASFSDTLYSNGTISSRSWSYTAGAFYRLKSVFGQLIFGGYDANRFVPNDVIFTMTGDNLRDIVVTIRSITSTTSSGNTTLMSDAEFAYIDSTVPELWLPVEVCEAFESAFGLQLDSDSGLYLLNSSTHDNLVNLNPNITITLADQKSGGQSTDIVLPYSAFDLNVSAPIYNGSSLYFPIRRATDASMYTLGRTFLQEAYVTTHYNSRTFNVSQCIFSEDTSQRILALPSNLSSPTNTSTSTGADPTNTDATSDPASKSSKLGAGAIAGIVVGSIGGLTILGLVIFFCLRRRRRENRNLKDSDRSSTPVVEIDSGKRIEPNGSSAYTAQASAFTHEAGGTPVTPKVEIGGNPVMHPQELEAEVPLFPGNAASPPLNGPSDSSNTTGVSSMSPIGEEQRLAELSGGGMRNLERGNDFEVVSPTTPTTAPGDAWGSIGHGYGYGSGTGNGIGQRSRDVSGISAMSGPGAANPEIMVSSPVSNHDRDSEESPRTRGARRKHESRFEERWS
ncbi:eukaryotic aspartyl protease [Phlyctema vagabunda]|uniref:Eukaryotic aspartyl protease n=1 Tax=Phlyctema vagabunda TaxID=108571 RepID=A0ABR4PLK4_9HELO